MKVPVDVSILYTMGKMMTPIAQPHPTVVVAVVPMVVDQHLTIPPTKFTYIIRSCSLTNNPNSSLLTSNGVFHTDIVFPKVILFTLLILRFGMPFKCRFIPFEYLVHSLSTNTNNITNLLVCHTTIPQLLDCYLTYHVNIITYFRRFVKGGLTSCADRYYTISRFMYQAKEEVNRVK